MLVVVLSATLAGAQEPAQGALRLRAVMTTSTRGYLTDSWALLQIELDNLDSKPHEARVVALYATRPDVQYGRDVWIPAHSVLSTWLPAGPPPASADQQHAVELQTILYDRVGDKWVRQSPPGEQRLRSRPLSYRTRQPATTLLLDPLRHPDDPSLADDDAQEVTDLVRVFRQTAGLSEPMGIVRGQALPPTPETLAGIDHVVLASRAFTNDPPGQQLLRRWLEQGGKLWVLLDHVDPDVLAGLLGETVAPQVVERTSLTTVTVKDADGNVLDSRQYDRPIDFVRVLPGPDDTVLETVDGWPALFSRRVGRGELFCTTLGPRAWYRPRISSDPPSTFTAGPDLPVALPSFEQLIRKLHSSATPQTFDLQVFAPLVGDDIGYALISPSSAALLFGAFLLAVLLLGLLLRRSRRPELLGWLGPAAALAAGAVFIGLGELSRRSVPPTVAAATIIDVAAGTPEQPVQGLVGVYRPGAGAAPVSSDHGGMLRLDMSGNLGQNHQRIATDTDAWHWENLELPAGVRLGTFQATLHSDEPIGATAHFRGHGIEGTVHTGPFHALEDAVLLTPTGLRRAVQLSPNGQFSVGEVNLPRTQYIAATVLSDRQQRRQAIYRHLLDGGMPAHLRDRTVLLGWASEADVPFAFDREARTTGSTLLIIPVSLERPAPRTEVTVPAAFIPCRRVVLDMTASLPLMESRVAADQPLRFQLPTAVLPLELERARLSVRVHAKARRFSVLGLAKDRSVELEHVDSPDRVIQVDITRKELLQLDSRGRLSLELRMSELLQPSADEKIGKDELWTLSDLGLEVTGRVPEEH